MCSNGSNCHDLPSACELFSFDLHEQIVSCRLEVAIESPVEFTAGVRVRYSQPLTSASQASFTQRVALSRAGHSGPPSHVPSFVLSSGGGGGKPRPLETCLMCLDEPTALGTVPLRAERRTSEAGSRLLPLRTSFFQTLLRQRSPLAFWEEGRGSNTETTVQSFLPFAAKKG